MSTADPLGPAKNITRIAPDFINGLPAKTLHKTWPESKKRLAFANASVVAVRPPAKMPNNSFEIAFGVCCVVKISYADETETREEGC
ncbi:MAG: hypothetical protein ABSG59_09390 [Verrucomicrobiota bacterium]|jgi:hypothetical protein